MATLESFFKDPDEYLDYTIDWKDPADDFLGADTIQSSTWLVPVGITASSSAWSATSTTATAWVSGGTLGGEYVLVNRITTAGGRIAEGSIRIVVRVSS